MDLQISKGWKIGTACLAILALVSIGAAHSAAPKTGKERVVKVVAKRFIYTPNEIILKAGVPARLEFTSLDFVHGFKVPDLDIRVDLPPGKVTTVHLTPQKAGVYDFLCDNFCGVGHEEMSGKIIVKD
ncbi:MAG: cytochrome c oxidase subunit II [Betaproteobacteria bacterium]|nr:cytochrome c oxidase subunit II [Betaproteobacteria bacterium]